MDKKIREILEEKIHETMSMRNEIALLVKSLGYVEKKKFIFKDGSQEREIVPHLYLEGFWHWIIVGRLYNSFYNQSRRILKRDPTQQEFSEFIKLLEEHKNELSEITS